MDEYELPLSQPSSPIDSPPQRLVRAEAILRCRTSQIIIVLDGLYDKLNHSAILRTCDAMGIHHVWCVDNGQRKTYEKQFSSTVSQSSDKWLDIRVFETTARCIAALTDESYKIWCTSLSDGATELSSENFSFLPDRVAIVMGREIDGVSDEFIQAADKCIYLPQYGFAESLNVGVATALVLQRLFDIAPNARGNMPDEERSSIRTAWWKMLAEKDYEDVRDEWMESAPDWEVSANDCRTLDHNRIPRVTPRLHSKMLATGIRPIKFR